MEWDWGWVMAFPLVRETTCSPETIPHKVHQNRGLRQTHTSPPTSAPWRAAHIGEWRAVTGAGAIREEVASEQSERTTCRGYYSCCTDLLLFIITLQICYVWIFECLVGLLSNDMGLFSGERVLKNSSTPCLSSHLSSLPMGVFSRAYGTTYVPMHVQTNLHL